MNLLLSSIHSGVIQLKFSCLLLKKMSEIEATVGATGYFLVLGLIWMPASAQVLAERLKIYTRVMRYLCKVSLVIQQPQIP